MLYPGDPRWTTTLTASSILAGQPALVLNPSDASVFFAVSQAGTFGSLPSNGSNTSIVIGRLLSNGTISWLLRDDRLVSGTASDTAPALVLGSSGELYVAFETLGNVPGRYNAADVPSFCGSSGTVGRADLVVARIDGATTSTPIVAWVRQDAGLNSCHNETSVQLHWESREQRLYLVYTTSGSVQCTSAIGGPNIVVACWNPATGSQLWLYQGPLLNGTGANQAPSIATDGTGAVYVAYTVTAPVSGGGLLQGATDVEVVKLFSGNSGIVRNWILSAQVTLNAAGPSVTNTSPVLICDAGRDLLYLVFVTTGTVPGGTKTASTSELVFASLNSTGSLRWLLQSPTYNEIATRYDAVKATAPPRLVLDRNGALYAAAVVQAAVEGAEMVLVFRIRPGTQQPSWSYLTPTATFGATYAPAAPFDTPNRVLTTTGFTNAFVALGADDGRSVVLAISRTDVGCIDIFSVDQETVVFGQTAYKYMITYMSSFSARGYYSGGGTMLSSGSDGGGSPTLSAPTNLSVVVANATLYLLFDPPVEGSATSYTVVAEPGTLTVSSAVGSPIAIPGITNGTNYTLTMTAFDGVTTSPTASIGPVDTTYTFTTTSFTTSGSTTWTAPPYVTTVDYLIVGGGGGSGGGFDTGAGGGGGGGMVLTGTASVIPGTTYTVVVGTGGTAGVSIRSPVSETRGGAGGNSSFDAIIALGGEGGYASRQNGGISSAGGAAVSNPSTASTGGSGGGSAGDGNGAGGGGGGSSGNGTAGVTNIRGLGGSGVANSLSGSSIVYGRGGNGANGNTNTTGVAGIVNTGNGASAGGATSFSQRSGAVGGSGVVILHF